jgi:HEPN superfamily Swt1-like protein
MARINDALKLFGMTSQLIEHDLDRVEAETGYDLHRGHKQRLEPDQDYYPQIETAFRTEAAAMAPHYEVFYSLEKTIRRFVRDSIQAAEGDGWWNTARVPPKIKTDAEDRQKREIDTGMTPRSDDPLDFTTFGELGEVIKAHWDIFGSVFSSQKAVERVMGMLNSLRGPIAHCSPLAEDEVVRLRLAVRDWFRLMQ